MLRPQLFNAASTVLNLPNNRVAAIMATCFE